MQVTHHKTYYTTKKCGTGLVPPNLPVPDRNWYQPKFHRNRYWTEPEFRSGPSSDVMAFENISPRNPREKSYWLQQWVLIIYNRITF